MGNRSATEIACGQDLGCVIDGSVEGANGGKNVAPNGVVTGLVQFNDMGWVRNILFAIQGTGTWSVGIQRIVNGAANYVESATGLAAAAAPSIATKVVTSSDQGGKSIPGQSCRFYMKNTGTEAASASLFIQVMG